MTLRAERIEMNLASNEVIAEGNVVIDQGPSRLTGARAEFDLDTKEGFLTHATAAVEGDYFFSGDRISKIDEDSYTIDDGTFTTCRGVVPPWSFQVGRGRIDVESYARIRNARMRVRQVPVIYLPYVLWPTKTERASGLLVPKVGSSNDRGAYLGLAYYQVLGPSYDTTFFLDLYSEEFLGVGDEFRYHPTPTTAGEFRGYAIRDPDRDDWRWKLDFEHESEDLPWNLRGVVDFEDYSDFQFFRDFERDLNFKAKNSVYSVGYLSGNWGNQSLNVLADRRQRFITADRVVELAQLPEIDYDLRPTQLWESPVYLALDGAAHFLSVDRPGAYEGDYPRFELFPSLKVPLSAWPWLSLSVSAGPRITWYGDSLVTGEEGTGLSGESLSRLLPVAQAELVGPSFSRIFERSFAGFGKFKHLLEPRIDYSFVGEFDDQEEVPIFDELDPLSAVNVARVSLTNRVLAKPEGEDGVAGGAREILSFELSRRYSLDDDRALESGAIIDPETQQPRVLDSTAGPLEATLRTTPGERLGLRVDADYSVLFDRLTSLSLTGNVGFGANRVDLSWAPRYRASTGETLSNQVGARALLELLPERLTLASSVNYDFERELLRDYRHFITYVGSCYTLRLELHESRTPTRRRRDYLVSVDLKNVGTFLDLTGGQSEGL